MDVLTNEKGETDSLDRGGTGIAALVAVGLTLAAFAVTLVGGVAFIVPLILLEYDIESTAVFLTLTAVGQVGFLLVGYVYARYRGLAVRIARPDAREIGIAVAGVLGAFVTASVLSVVLATLGVLPDSVIEDAVTADPNVLLGLAVLSVVLVAPAEEFLFRGVIQGRLRQSAGPVGAIAGASLLFGSIHLGNYTGGLGPVVAGALLIAGTGSVFGVLYEYTRNLSVPIIAHATYNVLLVGLSYLLL